MFEQIEGDVSQNSKVLRTIALANATLVLPKGDVQDPMERVLNMPVLSGMFEHVPGTVLIAGDKIAVFDGTLVAYTTFRLNLDEGGQLTPVVSTPGEKLVSRSIRHRQPVVFSMFPLQDEEEKGQATVFVRESTDFIRLGAKFPKEAFEQVGSADQRM